MKKFQISFKKLLGENARAKLEAENVKIFTTLENLGAVKKFTNEKNYTVEESFSWDGLSSELYSYDFTDVEIGYEAEEIEKIRIFMELMAELDVELGYEEL